MVYFRKLFIGTPKKNDLGGTDYTGEAQEGVKWGAASFAGLLCDCFGGAFLTAHLLPELATMGPPPTPWQRWTGVAPHRPSHVVARRGGLRLLCLWPALISLPPPPGWWTAACPHPFQTGCMSPSLSLSPPGFHMHNELQYLQRSIAAFNPKLEALRLCRHDVRSKVCASPVHMTCNMTIWHA